MNAKASKIILFDGVCNLCNNAITFIIKRDKKDTFRYAPLQSAIGQQLVNERGIDSTKVDSIVLIDPGVAYYTKSKAVIEITKAFGGVWILFQVLSIFPKGFSDWVYDLIAKNRCRWFGKQESCMIPTPELKAKFMT